MNFINKFSYKLKFTEYALVIKVIMIMIIIIFKKTYLQFISTKKKQQNVLVKKLRKRNKWHKVKKVKFSLLILILIIIIIIIIINTKIVYSHLVYFIQ